MCGRYSIAVEPTEVEQRFGAKYLESGEPGEVIRARYNAAPSQRLPVILNDYPGHVVFAQWGIKLNWMTRVTNKTGLINVRAETLRDKMTFRENLEKRRCLVPADGFYEWKVMLTGKKAPFRIMRKDGKLFSFAGIWHKSTVGKESELVFAIITTTPNALMQPIHDRMPLILAEEAERRWLAGSGGRSDLIGLLKSPTTIDLRAYEVSRLVNHTSVDVPELIEPVRV